LVEQSLKACLDKTNPPFADACCTGSQSAGNLSIGQSIGCPKHDLRSFCHPLGSCVGSKQSIQLHSFFGLQPYLLGFPAHNAGNVI
jgi:hypothetical protein